MNGYYIDASRCTQAEIDTLWQALNDGRAVCNPGPNDSTFMAYIDESENINQMFQFPAGCQVHRVNRQ